MPSKKKLIIAGVCGFILIAIVATTLVLVLHKKKDNNDGGDAKPALDLENLLGGKFTEKRFNGEIVSQNQIMFEDEFKNLEGIENG